MMWINQPSAGSAQRPCGGMTDSGFGPEGGPEAVGAYLSTRAVESCEWNCPDGRAS